MGNLSFAGFLPDLLVSRSLPPENEFRLSNFTVPYLKIKRPLVIHWTTLFSDKQRFESFWQGSFINKIGFILSVLTKNYTLICNATGISEEVLRLSAGLNIVCKM